MVAAEAISNDFAQHAQHAAAGAAAAAAPAASAGAALLPVLLRRAGAVLRHLNRLATDAPAHGQPEQQQQQQQEGALWARLQSLAWAPVLQQSPHAGA